MSAFMSKLYFVIMMQNIAFNFIFGKQIAYFTFKMILHLFCVIFLILPSFFRK